MEMYLNYVFHNEKNYNVILNTIKLIYFDNYVI